MLLRQSLAQVRAHEAAQALVSDPGLSRLLTGWKQPEPPDEYAPAEPFGLRDRMSTITALRSQRLRPL